MRAARRISASVPGAPVMATSTRSRVSHGSVMLCRSRYSLEPLVDAVGEPEQRELAQRREVAGAEVVAERGVDAIRLVDVAVRHAAPQRLRRHVDELDLVGAAHDVVGDRLALLHAGDALDDVVHRLEVLDVERRDDVDPRLEQLLDVLPPLLVAGPGNVRVRELVDQRDVGCAGEHRVDVHLLELGAAVLDPAAGNDLEVADLLRGARAARGSRRSRRPRRSRGRGAGDPR